MPDEVVAQDLARLRPTHRIQITANQRVREDEARCLHPDARLPGPRRCDIGLFDHHHLFGSPVGAERHLTVAQGLPGADTIGSWRRVGGVLHGMCS